MLWIAIKWIGRVIYYFVILSLVVGTIDQLLFGQLSPDKPFAVLRGIVYIVVGVIFPPVLASRAAIREVRERRAKQKVAHWEGVSPPPSSYSTSPVLLITFLVFGLIATVGLLAFALLYPDDSGIVQLRTQLLSLVITPTPLQAEAVAPPTLPVVEPTRSPRPTATLRPRPSATPIPVQRIPVVEIVTDRLNIRAHPNTEAEIWAVANKGDQFIVVGENRDKSWLAIWYPEKGYAWVSGSDTYVRQSQVEASSRDWGYYETGTALFAAPSRPYTGVMSASREMSGLGELLIRNGSEQDSMAILSPVSDEPLVAVYIRKGDNFNIMGIPVGDYRLYFMSGDAWQAGPGTFRENASFFQFEEIFDFTETDEIDGDYINTIYTTYNVTLYGVVGGTANTPRVEESDFPPIP